MLLKVPEERKTHAGGTQTHTNENPPVVMSLEPTHTYRPLTHTNRPLTC